MATQGNLDGMSDELVESLRSRWLMLRRVGLFALSAPLALAVLQACGGEEATPTAAPEVIVEATEEPEEPTEVVEAEETEEPEEDAGATPAAATPVGDASPVAMATPVMGAATPVAMASPMAMASPVAEATPVVEAPLVEASPITALLSTPVDEGATPEADGATPTG